MPRHYKESTSARASQAFSIFEGNSELHLEIDYFKLSDFSKSEYFSMKKIQKMFLMLRNSIIYS